MKHVLRSLGRCHSAAHVEKEETNNLIKQTVNDTRLSSPFGEETAPLKDLTNRLIALPFSELQDRKNTQFKIKEAFLLAPGDTRRPQNEVTLWDWSHIVAALYKSALAVKLLSESEPDPDCLKWRLLALRFDGSGFINNATTIPILLARQQWLKEGLDRVQHLLEEYYPLGTEIYRDENGSIFVIPDLPDLLEYKDKDENGQSLAKIIQEILGFDGELVIAPEQDQQAWRGQPPNKRDQYEIPPIVDYLQHNYRSTADPLKVEEWWRNYKGQSKQPEICTVSKVRPRGPSKDGIDRKISDYWLELSNGRAKTWATQMRTGTVWIDEVTDQSGRIALIVGQFDLNNWLNGTMIKTLVVNDPKISYKPKNASFARIRRVWETTRRFWEEIETGFENSVGRVGPRLRITGQFLPDEKNLGVYHAYELKLGPVRFSIVCVKREGEKFEFISAENLDRAAARLAPQEEIKEKGGAAKFLKEKLENEQRDGFEIEEPTGYGSPNKLRGKLKLNTTDGVKIEQDNYLPVIPILAEPRTFMALVPADKSLEVVAAIKEKYECEMGKVRNRLPLTVGVVYAGARTPLPAILDAGRRMLTQPTQPQNWQVKKDVCNPNNAWPDKVEVELEQNGQTLKLKIPVKMGDESTQDVWYPYWKVEKNKGGNAPEGRDRQFCGPDGKQWVHVCDLKEGDTVELQPSRFDFEWLDTAARRFEISYTDGKRRLPSGGDWKPRPYYLEQVSEFKEIWDILDKNLSTSQIKALVTFVETKRVEWPGDENKVTFEQMVVDALGNLQWRKKPDEQGIKTLRHAAISGQLADVVELYMEIQKRKPKADQENNS